MRRDSKNAETAHCASAEAKRIMDALYQSGLRRGDVAGLRDILVALLGTLQQGARRGNNEAIATSIQAACAFTGIVEVAHKAHPDILRKSTHHLEKIPVLVDPMAVRDENKEFSQLKRYVLSVAGKRRAVQPSTQNSERLWYPIAREALKAMEMARTIGNDSGSTFFNALQKKNEARLAPFLDMEAVRKLPPLSIETYPKWWKQARIYILRQWEAYPEKKQKAIAAAQDNEMVIIPGDSRRDTVSPKDPAKFALNIKIYDAFRAQVRAKTR